VSRWYETKAAKAAMTTTRATTRRILVSHLRDKKNKGFLFFLSNHLQIR
jgi:hypothetical protein